MESTKKPYRHITACSNKRVCHGVYKLTRNSKITDFYFTTTIHKDVARFNITMYNCMFISQVTQAFQNLFKKERTSIT
jgi:hypothetical protein